MFGNVRKRSYDLRATFGKCSEIFGKSSKTSLLVEHEDKFHISAHPCIVLCQTHTQLLFNRNKVYCFQVFANCILFVIVFMFVNVRGRRCIQFTDKRDGTEYALKVIDKGRNVTFEVSLNTTVVCCKSTQLKGTLSRRIC